MDGQRRNRSGARDWVRLGLLLAAVLMLGTSPAQAQTIAQPRMLQFTSEGHALGFSPAQAFIAGADHALRVEFVGARPIMPEAAGSPDASASAALSGAPALDRVTYTGLWEGVTLTYEASPAALVKSTYEISPPLAEHLASVRLRYNVPVALDDGALNFSFATGVMNESAPVAWQEANGGRDPITVNFELNGDQVGFTMEGAFDPNLPLVIDPKLTWNTFLGADSNDHATGIAYGGGPIYVSGYSENSWGGSSIVRAYAGGIDGFLARMNDDGTVSWVAFLGSAGDDYAYGVAADDASNAYVVGTSSASWGLPLQGHHGGTDAFAIVIASDGDIYWNTFLGSADNDNGYAIDTYGEIYVAGSSESTWGTPRRPHEGGLDGFAAELSIAGVLSWNTFMGSAYTDIARGIVYDPAEHFVYVIGDSGATWGMVTPPEPYSGGRDAFVVKLNPEGFKLWNTFLGSTGNDSGRGVTFYDGAIYVTGYSEASWGTHEIDHHGGYDAFIARVQTDGDLEWNTFFGSSSDDYGYGIAIFPGATPWIRIVGTSEATWGNPGRDFSGGTDMFVASTHTGGTVINDETFYGSSGEDGGKAIINYGTDILAVGDSSAGWDEPVVQHSGGFDGFMIRREPGAFLQWNTFLGSSFDDHSYGIATDASGNIYIAGDTHKPWWGTYTGSIYHLNAYVAKLNSRGVVQWARFYGSTGEDHGRAVAVDSSSHVYLAGYSASTWGPHPVNAHAGGWDAFAAELDSNGSLLWNTFLGSASDDEGSGIGVDSLGNVYVSGHSHATWGSGASPLHPFESAPDVFLAKLNTSGTRQWNTFIGGAANENHSLVVDGSGNAYVGGDGSSSVFVAKFNSAGTRQWLEGVGLSSWDSGGYVAVDSSGNVYVAGTTDLSGGYQAFVARINSSGDQQWLTPFGCGSEDNGKGVAIDNAGNIYATGMSLFSWGTPEQAHHGGNDVFLARLSDDGTVRWNTFVGSSGVDSASGIAISNSALIVLGTSDRSWGTPAIAHHGGTDTFLVRIAEDQFLPFISRR